MVLRLSLILIVMALAAASQAEQCRLNGTWRSDSARTLAAIADKSDPAALNALSSDLFGHMIHEWTCTEMRAWFDDGKRPEASPYTVVEADADADVMIVSFSDSEDVVLRITFEGECYKVSFDEERFEYFCPVKRSDGA
jgi:hypothetical protein